MLSSVEESCGLINYLLLLFRDTIPWINGMLILDGNRLGDSLFSRFSNDPPPITIYPGCYEPEV
jgi:hypothetical protein